MIKKKPVKVIICGSRTFDNFNFLEEKVCYIFHDLKERGILYGTPNGDREIIEIISGGADGADIWGEWFASLYGLKCKVFPADWEHKGKQAGIIRNHEMVDYITNQDCVGLIIAFWDGESKGTQDCFNYGHKNGLDTHIILF